MMIVRIKEASFKTFYVLKNLSYRNVLTKCINIGNVMIFRGTIGPFRRDLQTRNLEKQGLEMKVEQVEAITVHLSQIKQSNNNTVFITLL